MSQNKWDEIRESYYEKTDMSSIKPSFGSDRRHYRIQHFGFSSKEKSYSVTGNIAIPVYCDFCSSDVEDESDYEYIMEHCKMEEPKFSAVYNETHDSIGWYSRCPNCDAQTYQVCDVDQPYSYKPD